MLVTRAYHFDCLRKALIVELASSLTSKFAARAKRAVSHDLGDHRSLQSLGHLLVRSGLGCWSLNKVREPFEHFFRFQMPYHRPESWSGGLHNILLCLSGGTQKVSDHAGKAK